MCGGDEQFVGGPVVDDVPVEVADDDVELLAAGELEFQRRGGPGLDAEGDLHFVGGRLVVEGDGEAPVDGGVDREGAEVGLHQVQSDGTGDGGDRTADHADVVGVLFCGDAGV